MITSKYVTALCLLLQPLLSIGSHLFSIELSPEDDAISTGNLLLFNWKESIEFSLQLPAFYSAQHKPTFSIIHTEKHSWISNIFPVGSVLMTSHVQMKNSNGWLDLMLPMNNSLENDIHWSCAEQELCFAYSTGNKPFWLPSAIETPSTEQHPFLTLQLRKIQDALKAAFSKQKIPPTSIDIQLQLSNCGGEKMDTVHCDLELKEKIWSEELSGEELNNIYSSLEMVKNLRLETGRFKWSMMPNEKEDSNVGSRRMSKINGSFNMNGEGQESAVSFDRTFYSSIPSHFLLNRVFGEQQGMHPKLGHVLSPELEDGQVSDVQSNCHERLWLEWIPHDYFIDPFQIRMEEKIDENGDWTEDSKEAIARSMWFVSQPATPIFFSNDEDDSEDKDYVIDLEAPAFAQSAKSIVYGRGWTGWNNDTQPPHHTWITQFHMRYQSPQNVSLNPESCKPVRFGFPTMFCMYQDQPQLDASPLSELEHYGWDIITSHLGHIIDPLLPLSHPFPPMHQDFLHLLFLQSNHSGFQSSQFHNIPGTFSFDPQSPLYQRVPNMPSPVFSFENFDPFLNVRNEKEEDVIQRPSYLELCVPVGDKRHEQIVTIGTLVITLAGTLYVCFVIAGYPAKTDSKKKKQ